MKGHQNVVQAFENNRYAKKYISVISYAELCYGAENSSFPTKNTAKVKRLRQFFELVELNEMTAEIFAKIKVDLSKQGNIVDNMDLLIGASCLSRDLTIVSNNEKHFNRISGLEVANWSK